MSERLLSKQNLDEGFVTVPVQFLHGDSATVKLTAPVWRKRRELILTFQQSLDTFLFINACLAPAFNDQTDQVERFLNQLTPEAVARIEAYAVALTLGEDYQKKMQEVGKQVLEKLAETRQVTITSTGSESSAASPASSEPTKSRRGRGRESL